MRINMSSAGLFAGLVAGPALAKALDKRSLVGTPSPDTTDPVAISNTAPAPAPTPAADGASNSNSDGNTGGIPSVYVNFDLQDNNVAEPESNSWVINRNSSPDPLSARILWRTAGQDGISLLSNVAVSLRRLNPDSQVFPSAESQASGDDGNWITSDFMVDSSAGFFAFNRSSKSFGSFLEAQGGSSIAYYLAMEWTPSQSDTAAKGPGRSFTPYFAFYDGTDVTTEAIARSNVQAQNKQLGPLADEFPVDPTATLSSSPVPEATSTANAAPTDSLDSDESRSDTGSRLSTGATVGIAVGCGLFVLLLAAGLLFWFCIYRRRRRGKSAGKGSTDHVHEGYNAAPGGPEYVVDKEIHQRSSDSPGSPYSDDAIGVAVTGVAAAAPSPTAAPVGAGAGTGAGPAPKRQSSLVAAAASGQDSAHLGAAAPHAVSSSVAHLVEDGMTVEEIRRLEEEERALDAAIEEAGRGR